MTIGSGHPFPKEYRLRRAADFERAFRLRRSAGDAWLVVYGYPNDLDHPRLGMSVSRKVGNAVRRNRWKRLLREAFRLHIERLPAGLDLVIVPRRDVEPALEPLATSLMALSRRIAARIRKEST